MAHTRTTKIVTVKELIEGYIFRIDLDADYQREVIWTRKNQEELLDSIIEDIDIPKIYLAKIDSKEFDFECVDGKQRMTTLLNFFKPDKDDESPLRVKTAGEKYTFKELKKDVPTVARKIESFKLTLIIYDEIKDDEVFIREIFRRLQWGVRLNSGELLKTYDGTVRDFIYKHIGNNGPFLRKTKLSEKRFSRQFTLAQICINSFRHKETGDFGRARFEDLKDFLKEKADLSPHDQNLVRIKKTLNLMDKHFGQGAEFISSRAVAVSAYLFSEYLYLGGKESQIEAFSKFYVALLQIISEDLELISKYKKPKNTLVLDRFQKYILQASVEPYSIRRRHEFLKEAFAYYMAPKTRKKIMGSR